MVLGKGMMFSVSLLISVVCIIDASPCNSDATTVQGDLEKSNRQNGKQAVKYIRKGFSEVLKDSGTLFEIVAFLA
jgi:hypothetical protein